MTPPLVGNKLGLVRAESLIGPAPSPQPPVRPARFHGRPLATSAEALTTKANRLSWFNPSTAHPTSPQVRTGFSGTGPVGQHKTSTIRLAAGG
jgi:hypothetical protein